MARRSVQVQPANLARARARATGALRTILSRFDTAEYEAQLHAADMVAIQAGIARDVTQPIGVRVQCTELVLNRAYGKVADNTGPTQVDYGSAIAEGGTVTIAEQIEAARRTADQLQELDAYIGKPPDTWPERIRAIAGDLGALWADGPAEAQTGDQPAGAG